MAKSIHSPKNKYYGEISFARPRKGIGSIVSFSSDDIDELKNLLSGYAPGHVKILENKSTYPEFDWQIIYEYNI